LRNLGDGCRGVATLGDVRYVIRVLLVTPEVRRAAPSAVERAKIELDRALGTSKLLLSEDACRTYAADDSDVAAPPADVVVVAETAKDIEETLRVAERHGVPVTPRAGGSGRTGGAVPAAGGIVLATHALNQVKEIDPIDMLAVVQPGVVTGAFHAMCEKEGLFYPPDPNSLDMCMIGGNVAENAGGPRAFKYGVTREYVLGLGVCLMGGRSLSVGRRTVKGVTGYDLTALFVGSEGTLGVFSEITLRLVRKPPEIATLLALFTDIHACSGAVARVLGRGLRPRCLELLDAPTLDAVRGQVSIDPRAGAMLLCEVDGDGAAVESEATRLGEALSAGPGVVDVLAAQDPAQRARLWAGRRALSHATRKLARHKLSEDVVVPRSKISELLRRVDAIGEENRTRHLTYGHAGDGNLHVNFLWDDESQRHNVDLSLLQLMRATIELGGTLSGEHGIGVTKAEYLPLEQSRELVELQRSVKRVFDPKELLNPGKIFPAVGHKAC
jgi:glycolate oxidase